MLVWILTMMMAVSSPALAGVIKGYVKNTSGVGIENIVVIAGYYQDPENPSTWTELPDTTDATGYYEISNVPDLKEIDIELDGAENDTEYMGQTHPAAAYLLNPSKIITMDDYIMYRGGTLEGRITYGDTSGGAAGVEVKIFGQASREDIADANGDYSVKRLDAGNYQIWIVTPTSSYYLDSEETDFQVTSQASGDMNDPADIDISLTKGGWISGSVSSNPMPVSAIVKAYSFSGHVVASANIAQGSDGTYEITKLPAGLYRLEFVPATTSSYMPYFYNNKYTLLSATLLNIQLGQGTSISAFQLIQGHSLSGTITIPSEVFGGGTGAIAHTMELWVEEEGVYNLVNSIPNINISEQSNTYEIESLLPLTYYIKMKISGFPEYLDQYYKSGTARSYEIDTADSVLMQTDQSGINFEWVLGGQVSGAVTYSNQDDIGKKSTVQLLNDDGSGTSFIAETDPENGNTYEIVGITPGTYGLTVYPPAGTTGYLQEWYQLKYSAQSMDTFVLDVDDADPDNDSLEYTFDLTKGGGTISGFVTIPAGDTMPENMNVRAYDLSGLSAGSGEVETDGSYLIEGLPLGDYKVGVDTTNTTYVRKYYNDAYEFESAQTISLTGDQLSVVDINFVLEVGGEIAGTVSVSGGGNPPAGTIVRAYREVDSNFVEAASVEVVSGSYTISGLLPRVNYRIGVFPPSGYANQYYQNQTSITDADSIYVTEGATQQLSDIVLQQVQGTSIAGSVNFPDTAVGFTVRLLVNPSLTEQTAATFESGVSVYELTGISPGSYFVYIEPESDYLNQYYLAGDAGYAFTSQEATALTVSDGDQLTGIDFDMTSGGTIEGVVSSSGIIPPNTWVKAFDESGQEAAQAEVSAIDGSYQVKPLMFGTYKIGLFPPAGYKTTYYNNVNNLNAATAITVSQASPYQSGKNFTLEEITGSSISGTLIYEQGVTPVYCWVYALIKSTRGIGAYTQVPAGQTQYEISEVPEGNIYAVYVLPATSSNFLKQYYKASGYAFDIDSADSINLTTAQVVTGIDINMIEGGSISGAVSVSGGGTLPSNITVKAFDSSGKIASSVQVKSGTYTLSKLAYVQWRIGIFPPTGYYEEYYNNQSSLSMASPLPLTVDQPDLQNIDFVLDPKPVLLGDLNQDAKIDLADAIIALKAMGNYILPYNFKANAVDGGAVVGMPEAIYGIQSAGELRN